MGRNDNISFSLTPIGDENVIKLIYKLFNSISFSLTPIGDENLALLLVFLC